MSGAASPAWRLLENQVGYEALAPKKAVIDTPEPARFESFRLTRIERRPGIYTPVPVPVPASAGTAGAEIALEGPVAEVGRVGGWKGFYFHLMDFSALREPGLYLLELLPEGEGEWVELGRVELGRGIQRERSLAMTLGSFRAQRSCGRFDRADRAARFFGARAGRVDVHGGWFDASGDTSKYLSHLSYANYFNPQQTPMAVWGFLEAYDRLEAERGELSRAGASEAELERLGFLDDAILDEATWGADFLMRMLDPAGYFYATVFDRWSKEPDERMICSYSTQEGIRSERYEAGFRQGGGLAIAALARLSRREAYGDYSSGDYLAAAVRAFDHLAAHNLEYLPDGRENIIDDYCALLAAAELAAATGEARFAEAARARAATLCARQSSGYGYSGWWRSGDDGRRPYFHAVEEGLPIVALLRAAELGLLPRAERERALAAVRGNLDFELALGSGAANPFGYARELATPLDGEPRVSFFMPHGNETGYWWQGENARLASLAAAARMAAPLFAADRPFLDRLSRYSADQLDWIMGLNPFDSCMIYGLGRNNAEYPDYLPNIPGGICNGVTAGFEDESDIAFAPPAQRDDPMQSWRWGEQWICHSAWYVLAIALPSPEARGGSR